MYLSLNDGSNGLSGECHLAKSEFDRVLWRPATDNKVSTYNRHSCSSSCGFSGGADDEGLPEYGVADPRLVSSHDRVRDMDPMGGDLSINLYFIESTSM